MPLALIIFAAFLILTGIKGNFQAVGNQFQSDVMGQGGFLSFLAGILGIAVFFRLIGMPNAGRVFLILVILVFLMKNANVITELEKVTGAATPTSGGSALAPPLNLPGATAPSPVGTVFGTNS